MCSSDLQTVDNTGLADAYDPSTDKWTSLTPMPTKRSSGALGVYRGRLVFVGGECKNPQTRMTFDENEAYDPKTNSWASLAKPNTGLHAGGWAAVGDSLYFFGGNTGCGGDGTTVMARGVNPARGFQVIHGASYLLVADVGAWDNSRVLLLPGQSADPRSPHYRDFYQYWLAGQMQPLWFSKAAVDAHAVERTVLTPADS